MPPSAPDSLRTRAVPHRDEGGLRRQGEDGEWRELLSLKPVLDVMKPSTAVVLLRRCQWHEYTCVITPLDGSVGVKYGRKNVL